MGNARDDNDTRPCRVCKLKRSLRRARHGCDGELYVLRHDGDAFGVYRAQIRIFEETDHASLASWRAITAELWNRSSVLFGSDGSRAGDSSRPVAVRFLHAAGGRCAFCGRPSSSCLRGALPPVDLRAVCQWP
ncbi:hypothetical protein EVAR_85400_1 [Eumeta japonica]|uniref:Uncharacterized protein n=1 Tax=Eumeta variegata TaxID=151549 RepID=A0A4C1SJF1_EUMVA|nr:hypothetical protein EVAR_85400_1 [Eumeta japonica]